MTRFKGMVRSLQMANFLVTGCAISFWASQYAYAQPMYPKAVNSVDFICYMRTKDGQVVNLSDLCANRRPVDLGLSTLPRNDQQFLQRYQGFLEKRAKVSPAVQPLLAQSQQDPQSLIQRAKGVCTGQAQPISDRIAAYLFQTMAAKQYCRE